MAYDKVVDSAVLDAGLLQIANAIREKAGTEGALAFPDGLVEAIAAIEAGCTVVEGSLTYAENSNSFPNDLAILDGALPSLLIFYLPESVRSSDMESYSLSFIYLSVVKLIDTTPLSTGYADRAGITISSHRFSGNGDFMVPMVQNSVRVSSSGIRLYNLNYIAALSGKTFNYIAVWGLDLL